MTAKVERLVNLTVALLEARRPLTFAELRRRTGYYDQRDHESARRMFERDKDDLRKLGVPVVTEDVAFGEELGYRIPRDAYELPDLDLTADEVAALALAVRVSGAQGSALALAKLAARAPDPAEVAASADTRIDVAPDPVDAIADAVIDRAALRFTYRAATGSVSSRTVDPYAVVQRRGAWYLVAHDHDRDAVRAFRLDRIESRPRRISDGASYEVPPDLDLAGAVAGPETDGVTARVAVAPHARWALEARGAVPTSEVHDGWDVLRVEDVQIARDRAWLLGLGADVVVLDPPELRDAVVRALRGIVESAS